MAHTVNRVTTRVAQSSHGPFSLVRHVGRRSGRTYETPVILAKVPDGFVAELRGWAPLVALEVEYSLVERTSERDLLPMAREMGLGVLPWAALAKGVLTGKYTRADLDRPDPTQTRKNLAAAAGVLSERGLTIAEAVCEIAAEIGHTPSQVALAWTLRNPAVTAPIIGARTLPELEDNLGALEVTLTSEQLAALENASGIDLGFPHELLLRDRTRRHIFDGTRLEAHI